MKKINIAKLTCYLFLFISSGICLSEGASVEGPKMHDSQSCIRSLQAAIQLRTVQDNDKAFIAFDHLLSESFPHAMQMMEKVKLDNNIVYKWDVEDTRSTNRPILYLAHQDVVDADAHGWQHPPYGGVIDKDYIWGRGVLDNKGNLIAMMCALEALAKAGKYPATTLYFAFTTDEETGGTVETKKIKQYFLDKQIKFDYLIDEGGIVLSSFPPFTDEKVALIGIQEKGYISLKLSVQAEGGHASRPPRQSAIGIMARAISKIEAHKFKAYYDKPAHYFYGGLSEFMSGLKPLLFKYSTISQPLLTHMLSKNPDTNASIRTTAITTQITSSSASANSLSQSTEASLNIRIHPRDNVSSVMQQIEKSVNDERVVMSVLDKAEPSKMSSIESEGYLKISGTFKSVYSNNITILPYLLAGSTDSKHFAELTDNIYRVSPFTIALKEASGIHGVNERVSIESFIKGVNFYRSLFLNAALVPKPST